MNLLSFYDSGLNIPFASADFSQSTGQWTPIFNFTLSGETKEIVLSGLELNSFISQFSLSNIINGILTHEDYPSISQSEAESLFLNP